MSDWIETIIQAAAIIIGAAVVAWQVGKQFEHGRTLQQQNAREKLWLEIYREIAERSGALSVSVSEVSNFVTSALSGFHLKLEGIETSLDEKRSIAFHTLHHNLIKKVIETIRIIERYEIIKPELSIFRTAFSVAIEDVYAANDKLFMAYLKYLPIDVPENLREKLGNGPIFSNKMNKKDMEKFEKISNEYLEAINQVMGFQFDLNVETQNLLLGNLFEHRVQRRQPIDPSIIVVATEPPESVEKLKSYFEEETRWGSIERKAKADAREKSQNLANKTSS